MARRSRIALFVLLLAAATAALAGIASNPPRGLSYDVHFLASDALEGRFSGSSGARVAARFIAERFAALGLEPRGEDGYLQPFEFIAGVHPGPDNSLVVALPDGEHVARLEDDYRPLAFSSSGDAAGEVVFAGYGIASTDLGYDDYAGLDVEGKVVLVLRFSPDGNDPDSRFQPHMALRRKAADARERGAAAVLIATGPVETEDKAPVKISFDASFADSGLPVVGISTDLAESLFAAQGFTLADLQRRIDERKEPASRPLGITASLVTDVVQERATAENVVALLPGRDAALRGQVVVVGAHYDHLGYGGEGSGALDSAVHAIHNGADDNASGVAGLLEVARRLAAEPPGRGVLFAAFAGEEEGLLGSQHLVADPPVPTADMVAMINLDMVGRPKGGTALTVGGYGTATEWPALVEEANHATGLEITTSKGGFGASDHSSFYSRDVPVLFLFTGAHEDYHRPTDDADRIDFKGMQRVVTLAARLAREIADAPERPTFQKVAEEQGERRSYKVRTGVIPEFGYDGPGFKISGVAGNSPAEKAGLAGGDVVVRFGEREIRNIYDYMYALGDHKPGDTVVLVVRRGEETLELPVTLEPGRSRGN